MQRGNAFGRVCLYVCPVQTLTFASLDLETSFLVRRYILRTSRSSLCVKDNGSRSRSYEQKWSYLCRPTRMSRRPINSSTVIDSLSVGPGLTQERRSSTLKQNKFTEVRKSKSDCKIVFNTQ